MARGTTTLTALRCDRSPRRPYIRWNYRCGPAEERQLLTGEHTIQEIYCVRCESNVGWTYLRAYEQSQQYKVGKFILEKGLITKLSVKRGNPFKADRDAAAGKPRSGSRAHSAAPPPEPMETTGSA